MNGEDVRIQWLRDRDQLDHFGQLLGGRIESQMRARGLWADVQNRTKSIDSVLRKLLLKPEYTFDSLPDLVGVRVIVRYVHEVQQVNELVAGMFDCTEADDKSVRLAEDGVGYLSIHREARLKAADPELPQYPAARFRAEVQMRTLAQHLWAEMSHDTFYKTDERAVSAALKRRINLMAGLLEVADNEFDRLPGEVAELPNMLETGVLRRLEASYFQFAVDRGNPDLSLQVIELLLPLYAAEPGAITARIEEFVAARRDTINAVLDEQRHVPERRSAFMFQPEVLMLYERLDHDPLAVRERWARMFPEQELERVALAFGISFDE